MRKDITTPTDNLEEQCVSCNLPRVDGTLYCKTHQDTSLAVRTKQGFYDLDRTEYLKKLGSRSTTLSKTRSLREEIGILRATLERILSLCETDDDLIFRSPEIMNLVRSIESTTKTSFTMEKELNELFSYDDAKELAEKLLSITLDVLSEEVEDAPRIIEKLADEYAKLYS